VLDLDAIPEKLVVIGGGVIGMEMASYYNSVGSKVTVVEMMDKIAGPTDREISNILMNNYAKKGIEFRLGCKVTEVGNGKVTFEENGEIKSVDADKVLTHVPIEEFPAQTLTCELYLEAGIRACEIGYILADRDPVTRENRFGGLDLVRLCIPRRVYTDNHMKVIAAALKNVYDRRETITRGLAITKEAPLMRHFTVELERLGE
jgi:tryptophanase